MSGLREEKTEISLEDRCWVCGRDIEELKTLFREHNEQIKNIEFYQKAEIVLLSKSLGGTQLSCVCNGGPSYKSEDIVHRHKISICKFCVELKKYLR